MASSRMTFRIFDRVTVLLVTASALASCTTVTVDDGSDGGGGSAATGGTSGGGGSGGAAVTGGASGSPTGGTGPAGSGAGGTGGTVAGASGASGTATGGAGGTAGSLGPGGNAGSGGASGASGVGGAGGTSGGGAAGASSGGGGASSGSGGSGGAAMGSSGCGKAVTQTARQWVEMTPLDVSGTMRRWWTYLPNNYSPTRAYPVVFLFHGCGTETNNVPMQNVVGENAILVRSKAVTDCWDTGTSSPDIAFFDAQVAAADAGYCVDTTRRFAVGYSSGSWLINTLECVRGGVLRAAASVAGGSPRRNSCTGPTLARLFVHDLNDMDNAISGSIVERDRLLTANGCNATAMPVAEDPAPCARYQGCMPGYPVIWCETMGQGHARQDTLASTAAWGLFTEL
jgi:poly(3-hydroxybutyrate) depolymerase